MTDPRGQKGDVLHPSDAMKTMFAVALVGVAAVAVGMRGAAATSTEDDSGAGYGNEHGYGQGYGPCDDDQWGHSPLYCPHPPFVKPPPSTTTTTATTTPTTQPTTTPTTTTTPPPVTPPKAPPPATSGIAGFRANVTATASSERVGSAVVPTLSPAARIPVPVASPRPAAAAPPIGDALGQPVGIPGSALVLIGAAGAAMTLLVVRGTLGRRPPHDPRSFDDGETLRFR